MSPSAGATKPIAALGDLEGGVPGARYAGSAGILPAWGRPRRIEKVRKVPEATALCCVDPMRTRRPRSQGGDLPKRFRFAESYPAPSSRPGKDSIMTFASMLASRKILG
ncbi:MAG: hypothetical protein [Olavius algarvensis Gamma 1 endosymbiont]|nr:MAG: hypothetical protein [Olavius algarvensis Gamma 1 endosymbiont]